MCEQVCMDALGYIQLRSHRGDASPVATVVRHITSHHVSLHWFDPWRPRHYGPTGMTPILGLPPVSITGRPLKPASLGSVLDSYLTHYRHCSLCCTRCTQNVALKLSFPQWATLVSSTCGTRHTSHCLRTISQVFVLEP
jgi:hypothetical protein